jgi:arylsulfatase A-like enzyme
MKKLTLLKLFIPLSIIALLTAFLPKSKEIPPNIVVIFMNDLGYGDLSCFGALDYRTPNLDKMATEGIRFTNFLAAQAVCSASQSALMTRCYPNRIGFSGALLPIVLRVL